MKMKKCVLAMAAALLLAGAVSAQQTATNYATAGVIKADGDRFMDVNDWQQMTFDSNFLFSELKGNSISAGFASKTMFPVYVGVFFDGNTWEEDPVNTLSVIAGKDNKAAKVSIGNGIVSNDDLGATISCDITGIAFEAGINEAEYTVHAAVGYDFGSEEVMEKVTFNYSALSLSAGGTVPLYKKGALAITGGADIGFNKVTGSVDIEGQSTTPKASVTTITIIPSAALIYPLDDIFAYGMNCSIPVVFGSTAINTGTNADSVTHNDRMYFEVDNGISGDLIANKLRLNVGLRTRLPSIDLDDDDSGNGELTNTYYAGATLKLSDNVEIDSRAQVLSNSYTGTDNSYTSADTLWKTNVSFTVSVKF